MQNYNKKLERLGKFDRIEPFLINSGQTKATSSRNHQDSNIKKQDSVNTIFNDTK